MLLDAAWLLAVLTLALLSPGPDFLLIVRQAVGGSRAVALATAAGICAGLAVHMAAISLGLAALPPHAMQGVQFAGVAVLAWIGLRTLLARPASDDAAASGVPPSYPLRGFIAGLACNITNPKAFVFFVSLFAQAVRPDSPPLWRLLVPLLVIVHGLTLWTFVVLALQAPQIARRLARAQRWLPRALGAALLLMAIAVLLEALSEARAA